MIEGLLARICKKRVELAFCVCPWQESDLRPSGPEPDALSTELQRLVLSL